MPDPSSLRTITTAATTRLEAAGEQVALFTFPSFADYETYRERFGVDPEFVEADRIRDESGCVIRYERTFMRPLLPDSAL